MWPQVGIFLLIVASAESIKFKYAKVGSNVTLSLGKNVTHGWMRFVNAPNEDDTHQEYILRCNATYMSPRCLIFVTEVDTPTKTTARVLENGDLFIQGLGEYDSGLYSELILEEEYEGDYFPESVSLIVLGSAHGSENSST